MKSNGSPGAAEAILRAAAWASWLDEPTRKFEKIKRRSKGDPDKLSASQASIEAGFFDDGSVPADCPIGEEDGLTFRPFTKSASPHGAVSMGLPMARGGVAVSRNAD